MQDHSNIYRPYYPEESAEDIPDPQMMIFLKDFND